MFQKNYNELKNTLYSGFTGTVSSTPSWYDKVEDFLGGSNDIYTSPVEDEDEDEEDTEENTNNQNQQDDKTKDKEDNKTDSDDEETNNNLTNNEVNKNKRENIPYTNDSYEESKSNNKNNKIALKNSTDSLLKGKISNSDSKEKTPKIDPIIDDSKDNIYKLQDKDTFEKFQKRDEVEEIKDALYNKNSKKKFDTIIDDSKDNIYKLQDKDTFEKFQKRDEVEEIKDALYNKNSKKKFDTIIDDSKDNIYRRAQNKDEIQKNQQKNEIDIEEIKNALYNKKAEEKTPKSNPVIDNGKDNIYKLKDNNTSLEEIKEALYGKKTVGELNKFSKKIIYMPEKIKDKSIKGLKKFLGGGIKFIIKNAPLKFLADKVGKDYSSLYNLGAKFALGKDAAGMLDISHKKINDESYIKNAIKIDNYKDKRFEKYEGYLKEKLTEQFKHYNIDINEIPGYYFMPESEPSQRIVNDSEFRDFLKNNKDNILNNKGNLSIEFKKDNLYYAHHYADFINYKFNERGDLLGDVSDTNDYNENETTKIVKAGDIAMKKGDLKPLFTIKGVIAPKELLEKIWGKDYIELIKNKDKK